ncbi:MAG: hypothetical protein AABZ53_02270 [Planctomycetota bacterium]
MTALLALRVFLPKRLHKGPLPKDWLKQSMKGLRGLASEQMREVRRADPELPDVAVGEIAMQTIRHKFGRRVDPRRGTLAQLMSGVVRRIIASILSKRVRRKPRADRFKRTETVVEAPEDLAETSEQQEAVLWCLRQLDEPSRQALSLRFGGLAGMELPTRRLTNSEGCKATRALARLRELLAGYWASRRWNGSSTRVGNPDRLGKGNDKKN